MNGYKNSPNFRIQKWHYRAWHERSKYLLMYDTNDTIEKNERNCSFTAWRVSGRAGTLTSSGYCPGPDKASPPVPSQFHRLHGDNTRTWRHRCTTESARAGFRDVWLAPPAVPRRALAAPPTRSPHPAWTYRTSWSTLGSWGRAWCKRDARPVDTCRGWRSRCRTSRGPICRGVSHWGCSSRLRRPFRCQRRGAWPDPRGIPDEEQARGIWTARQGIGGWRCWSRRRSGRVSPKKRSNQSINQLRTPIHTQTTDHPSSANHSIQTISRP